MGHDLLLRKAEEEIMLPQEEGQEPPKDSDEGKGDDQHAYHNVP